MSVSSPAVSHDEMILWVDGQLVSRREAALRPDDHSLVGDGVFEAIKLIDGRPFALSRHLTRLAASAVPLGLPVDLAVVRGAVAEILTTEQARHTPSWLRITVTGGSAPMGTGAVGSVPTVVVAIAPMAPWGPVSQVVIAPWTRNERGPTAGLKTISYADNVIAYRHARRLGADESIFANTKGLLCEGTGTNVFVAFEGRLCTPSLASGCLSGITRQLLLEWMPEIVGTRSSDRSTGGCRRGVPHLDQRDVHPIALVDSTRLPHSPGPLTRAAMAAWTAHASVDNDP